MSVFAMESQFMKTIMIHLADKSDFILSDHETSCKSLQQIQLSLQTLRTLIFPPLSLPFRKFQSVVNTNPTKRLAPYFASWCASPP